MTDDPVELDEHRGMAAQKSTEIRRRLHQVQADQAALRRRQEIPSPISSSPGKLGRSAKLN